MLKPKKIIGSILFIVGLILFWQLLYVASTQWFGWMKPYAFPYPKGVYESFISMLTNGTLFMAIAQSFSRVLIGFAISLIIGIILGVIITKFHYLSTNLKPLILGIQTLPSICWVPFAILWFGLTEQAIIFVVVMGSAFSIALTIESAIKNIPPLYIKAAKTMGTPTTMLYTKVIFPAALPAFVAGLKQAWSFAWRALMSGEVMSASVGLGYTLMLGRNLADINQVMTIMLIILLLGIVMDKGIFSNMENHILKKRGLIKQN